MLPAHTSVVAMSRHDRHSLLPHFLAALYGLSIAYASLQPFGQWIVPEPATPFFLFAPWPPRWTRFDALANMLAYLPFGFFAALVPRRRSAWSRLSVAVAAGGALSFVLESLQMFLPPRDANAIDLLANALGSAAGGALALLFLGSTRVRDAIRSHRERWFLPGRAGDLGLALITIWLAVQINPGIPLFATVFDPTPQLAPVVPGLAAAPDVAATLVEAAHSALQVLGVGLFVALLMRERRYVGAAVIAMVAIGLALKGIAAALLLKPAAWEHWLSPAVSTGVAAGALALPMFIFLPRPAQVACCAVALLSSLLSTLLAPELLHARAPLSLFNWSYGHLLNFNGLTRTVLMLWPVAVSIFLFTLAGRPGWGEPS
jgi:VanZ family protein